MNGRRACLTAVAAAFGLGALAAGCAQNASPAADSATAPAATATATRGATGACASRALTITIADNNKSFCVSPGAMIIVYLRGTLTAKWTAIRPSSIALTPRVDVRLDQQAGVTGAAFEAIHPGVAVISSIRYPCAGRVKPTSTMHCGVIERFRAAVTVQPS
jgi:hypothetical protein